MNDPRTVVYLSYGTAPTQIAETTYALYSALRARGDADISIVLYTDNPAAFKSLPISVRPVSESDLISWRGAGYAHRIKAAVIRDALQVHRGAVVFMDSDTWIRRPLEELFERVAPNRTVLHISEGAALSSPYAHSHALARQCAGLKLVDTCGRSYTIASSTIMWNSGVLGLHALDAGLMDEVLGTIDAVWSVFQGSLVVEQYAAGYWFMRCTTISAVDDLVYHYWEKTLRQKFGDRLPVVLASAASYPLERRLRMLHRSRPRRRGLDRLRQLLRRGARRWGMRTVTTPASWS